MCMETKTERVKFRISACGSECNSTSEVSPFVVFVILALEN